MIGVFSSVIFVRIANGVTKEYLQKKIHNLPEIFKVVTSFVSVSSKEKKHVNWIKPLKIILILIYGKCVVASGNFPLQVFSLKGKN